MRVWICPVSGGAFAVQLGLISELCQHQIRPQLVMGSSGGNVAAYLGLASNWSADAILELSTTLKHTMFASSWWPWYLSILPSWWIGYYKGSLYADGTGSEELFNELFTPQSITATELWTGTMNRHTGKGQLFCNRSSDDCYIQPRNSDLLASFWTRDCMPLSYLNGDITKISQVTMASASIPVLVPEKIIDGQRYVDGGTNFASPLTALQDRLRECIDDEPLHMDYISSFDLQIVTTTHYRSMYDNGTQTIGEMVKSMCVNDRLTAIELLRSAHTPGTTTLHFASLEGTTENIETIERIRSKARCSLVEYYPLLSSSAATLDLLTFTSQDIQRIITSSRANYGLRFWWVTTDTEESPVCQDSLEDLLETDDNELGFKMVSPSDPTLKESSGAE